MFKMSIHLAAATAILMFAILCAGCATPATQPTKRDEVKSDKGTDFDELKSRESQNGEVIKLWFMKCMDADEVARMLRDIVGVKAVAVSKAGAIVVSGAPERVRTAEFIVKELDTSGGEGGIYFVYSLKNARAEELAPMLQKAFDGRFLNPYGYKNLPKFTFFADRRTNSLFISLDQSNVDQIKKLIDELDRPVETTTKPTGP